MELLEVATKENQKNATMHELIARVSFIMEKFDKCVFHNKKAANKQRTGLQELQ